MISKASIKALILVIMFAITTILSSNSITTSYGYSPCNCVIFVMDDMADHGSNSVQRATMDYFISKNMPFTASIVVSGIGNISDSRVLDKVREGVNKNLFEIAIHGYRHINHALLTKEEQKDQLIKVNERLEYLFGKRADIFIPPFNEFNLHTIETMSELNISLLSTSQRSEDITSNPYKSQVLVEINNSKIGVSRISDEEPLVYHAPYSISILALQRNGLFGDDLVHEVLRRIDESIAKYGFAQVRLHTSDFAQLDTTTRKLINKVDNIKFQDLIKIVDSLGARNIKITSFAEIYPHSR
ncbi:MAG: polysaccharide deacetylase family protein [Thermoproteota archaeon]|nr:polysaccharide deacetylase family protein [Thermoproteota archaeon]